MLRRIVALALTFAFTAATPAAQQEPERPVFRSTTSIVEVTVVVRDRSGAFVPNLTIGDFEVREENEPQRIQSLYVVEAPKSAAAISLSAVAASGNIKPLERTFIFLFDMEHLSPNGLSRARDAVVRYVSDRLLPSDKAGMAAVGGSTKGEVGTDRSGLVDAVKRLKPRSDAVSRVRELAQWPRILNEGEAVQIATNRPDVLRKALARACDEAPEECNAESRAAEAHRERIEADIQRKAISFVREARAAAQRSLATLDQIGQVLQQLPGRKTVVWVSEGTFSDELTEQARETAYRASQAGVAVYPLDPRGLARTTRNNFEQSDMTEAGADLLLGAAEDAADLLAVGSGGRTIRDDNNLERALRTIEEDTSAYYVLGYEAPQGRQRSKYRRLRVSVRREGVSVRARHGYMAPQDVTTRAVTQTRIHGSGDAGSPLDMTSLPGEALPLPSVAEMVPVNTAIGIASSETSVPAIAGRSLRLRPDADQQIEALARGAAAAAGDLVKKGWDAYQRGDVETAAVAFAEAASQPDVRPWVMYALGMSHAALARPADAVIAWERVRTAAPEFEPAYIDLADAYMQLEEPSKALAVLRDAERRWPSDPEIHNAIGVIQARRGALDDAIAAFTRAVDAVPDDPLGHFNLGRAYELRFARGQRYVSSHRQWVMPQEDLQRAEDSYRHCVTLGGPYAEKAAEALSRLGWLKK